MWVEEDRLNRVIPEERLPHINIRIIKAVNIYLVYWYIIYIVKIYKKKEKMKKSLKKK